MKKSTSVIRVFSALLVPLLVGLCLPSQAAPKLPRLECGALADGDAQMLCKTMQKHMAFTMGYHGVSPGFTIPVDSVASIFCNADISMRSVPALSKLALTQYGFYASYEDKIMGQTAVYLLALLGKDVIASLPRQHDGQAIEAQHAVQALTREVEAAVTGSVFSKGGTEHNKMLQCKKRA